MTRTPYKLVLRGRVIMVADDQEKLIIKTSSQSPNFKLFKRKRRC